MDPVSPPLPYLADEVWDLILHQLDNDPKAMASIRRVNKRLNRILLPSMFFKRIIFQTSKKSVLSVQYLVDSGKFTDCVKELEFEISRKFQNELRSISDCEGFSPLVLNI